MPSSLRLGTRNRSTASLVRGLSERLDAKADAAEGVFAERSSSEDPFRESPLVVVRSILTLRIALQPIWMASGSAAI